MEGKGFDPLQLGISFKYLQSLPIGQTEDFDKVCKLVREMTVSDKGYRSLAMHLYHDENIKHLVSLAPDAFVSYAWKGEFGKTMAALKQGLPKGKDDMFIWMDVAIVDQPASANTNIDFDKWTKTFGDSLKRIGRALMVLTPARKPIVTTRSWCCFEMYSIDSCGIECVPCIPEADEEELIEEIIRGKVNGKAFNVLFSGINVEQSSAFKKSDQESILKLMRAHGIVKVNDVVLLVIKRWLLSVLVKAEGRQSEGTNEMATVMTVRAQLHYVLVSFGIWQDSM